MAADGGMLQTTTFTLDGQEVTATPGESIWEVAKRVGTKIPHLCHADEPGYRSDGNCRACMVEIEGERVLAASCIRQPSEGMVVNSGSARAEKARKGVMELLLADQPDRADAHDASSHFWNMADLCEVSESRYPAIEENRIPLLDGSHVAMRVNLDSCIHCNLCVRACREVQVNDVIGMAGRGHDAKIVFDFDDPMGASSCVACGECVQACPTGALMPATVVDAAERGDSEDYDREVNSVCPYCGVGCQLTFKIKDDQIKYVEGANGPANEQRLCVKGRFGFDYIAHPHRLTKPLIRRDDAPAKGLNVDPGNVLTHFREATWEEALERAASGLSKVKEEKGGEGIAGFGSAKCSNEEAYLFQKMIREFTGHNNVDHCTRLCHASSVAALMENVGSGAVTATFNEIENADVAIAIGCNPVGNHPVAATYFKQFTKRGGTLITIDPRANGMFRHAKYGLQFKPGTDVALLNSIMNVIVEEGLTDRQYIEAFTENFTAQKAHLSDYTPESTAELTGIDPQTVREVARAFAGAQAAMIFWGMGVSQHTHGTDTSRCLISLALMTGQVGRPGAGLHPLRGQNNVQGASDAGLIPMVLPDYQSVKDESVRERFKKAWGFEVLETPGLTVVEIMDAVHAGDIRGMYVLGENPAMSDPDVDHARDALALLDCLVVQDIFLTETANYADVILPAAAWPEKNGTVTNTNRQVQMGRKALHAPGEAREDWAIVVDLANALGLDWTYKHPRDVFDEMKLVMNSLDNITWSRLENENAVTYPSLSPTDPGQPIVFGDGFPRAEGRAKFSPASYLPPAEEPDAEYPFVLSTGRLLEHWHTGSMTRRAHVLDALEPEASVSVHPNTLAQLGAVAGDTLKVETRRGAIELMARADTAVAEGSMFIPFAYVEAAANILTNPQLDPYGKIPEFKFCAAKLSKVDEVIAAE
jgi:formate dehydrogenase major subunit